jgi:isopentenyldiphosphate isomerase
MEYVDIYDESLSPLGKIPKAEAHQNGAWHKSIHCWIVRKDISGEYIVFQKRSATKKTFPNFLDISAAGHYQSGEELRDGVREIVEELGIKVAFDDLHYLGVKFDVYKDDKIFNREFCETFIYQDNRPLLEYPIDCDEVTGLAQIRLQDGLDLFSGKKDAIQAYGVEYSEKRGLVEEITINVNRNMFIARIDPYYGKIFMIAKAFFAGERELFI